MNAYEKGKLLKNTIVKLYVDEGRSISYIHKLLDINRQVLGYLIHTEWELVQTNQSQSKIKDYLASNKEFIVSRIRNGATIKEIIEETHVGRKFFQRVIDYDDDINDTIKSVSFRKKIPLNIIPDEIWKPIYGYENYEVSDYGRVRTKNGILSEQYNKKNGYSYVSLTNKDGKRKNLRIHRIVAHTFCSGQTDKLCEVNHIDGDKTNNKANNLEWCSKSENLIHSYKSLNRIHKGGHSINYIIIYKNKYKFKTISAFARFLGVSPTQAKRYIEESPYEHHIKKKYK